MGYNVELHNNLAKEINVKFTTMRWAEHIAKIGDNRKVFKILTGKPLGKRPMWKPSYRWENSIRNDLKKIDVNIRIKWINIRSTDLVWILESPCEGGNEPPTSIRHGIN